MCIRDRGDAYALPFMPENGMNVVICGYVSVYEKSGQYQLIAELMKPDGVGAVSYTHLAVYQNEFSRKGNSFL